MNALGSILTFLASVWAAGFVLYMIVLDADFKGRERVLASAIWPYPFITGWMLS